MQLTREQKKKVLEALAKDMRESPSVSDIMFILGPDDNGEALEFIEHVADWIVTHHPSQRFVTE